MTQTITRRRWNKRELTYLAQYMHQQNDEEIALILSRTRASVSMKRLRLLGDEDLLQQLRERPVKRRDTSHLYIGEERGLHWYTKEECAIIVQNYNPPERIENLYGRYEGADLLAETLGRTREAIILKYKSLKRDPDFFDELLDLDVEDLWERYLLRRDKRKRMRKFTEDEERYVAHYHETQPLSEIAEVLGRSYHSIKQKVVRFRKGQRRRYERLLREERPPKKVSVEKSRRQAKAFTEEEMALLVQFYPTHTRDPEDKVFSERMTRVLGRSRGSLRNKYYLLRSDEVEFDRLMMMDVDDLAVQIGLIEED